MSAPVLAIWDDTDPRFGVVILELQEDLVYVQGYLPAGNTGNYL